METQESGSDQTTDKLSQLIKVKEKIDQHEVELEQQAKQRADDLQTRKKAAAKIWPSKRMEIKSAVDRVNEKLEGSGLSFEYEVRQHDSAALAQDYIKLMENLDHRDRYIVVNVSAVGTVKALFLISHSGRGWDLSLDEASEDKWVELITDFLDQVLSYQAEKKGIGSH